MNHSLAHRDGGDADLPAALDQDPGGYSSQHVRDPRLGLARVQIEFWWLLERWSGHLWERMKDSDGVSAGWFDEVTAFTYRRRKSAERGRLW